MKLIISLIVVLTCFSCKQSTNNRVVIGKFTYNYQEDSIFFNRKDNIDKKYYEIQEIGERVMDNKFTLSNNLSYPHLFASQTQSERQETHFNYGNYFFDATLDKINLDTEPSCCSLNSTLNIEFNEKFIPFLLEKEMDCHDFDFFTYRSEFNEKFKQKLFEYVKLNSSSYVGLWLLIDVFYYSKNYDSIFEETFKLFTNEIKNSKIGLLLKDDLSKVNIKIGKPFPRLRLKDQNLLDIDLKLSKGNYKLVDFWFSHCKPCIASFPEMKELYNKYYYKGFEIISISIDRTSMISNWKKQIEKNQINWQHYLDENYSITKENRIGNFPTTFLVDRNNIVIKMNTSFTELDAFLDSELNIGVNKKP